jgi:hypothetical protein
VSADPIDTHGKRIEFGKYTGERWTRLPVSYLKWIVTTQARDHDIARAELERRGTPLEDDGLEISNHAIDSASLRLWAEYLGDKRKNEGLHRWLKRITTEALKGGEVDERNRVVWEGRVLLCLEIGPLVTVVKTCMIKHKTG